MTKKFMVLLTALALGAPALCVVDPGPGTGCGGAGFECPVDAPMLEE